MKLQLLLASGTCLLLGACATQDLRSTEAIARAENSISQAEGSGQGIVEPAGTTPTRACGRGYAGQSVSTTERTRNVRSTPSCSFMETYSPGLNTWLSNR